VASLTGRHETPPPALGTHDSFYEWDEAEKGRVASLCLGARGQWTRLWDCALVSRGTDEPVQRRPKTRLSGDFHPASREIKQERRPT
jgi:hypothetical protein